MNLVSGIGVGMLVLTLLGATTDDRNRGMYVALVPLLATFVGLTWGGKFS